jgi:PBSX family phage terminase large subunit
MQQIEMSISDLVKSLPENVREAMLADATAEVSRRRQSLQSTSRHAFRGAAKRLQTENWPEVAISGPARTGKSLAALTKVHNALLAFPGARGLIVRKTRASLTQSGLQTYEDLVLGMGNLISGGPARNNRSTYRYPNGSELVVGGMDKASRIMSTEYDIIYVQECTELTEDEYEMLSTRLSGSRLPVQQLVSDCNPSYPQHWLKRREIDSRVLMLESHHQDNPVFYNKRGEITERGRIYLARLEQLTGVRKERLLYGRWVAAEGAIYPEWSELHNMVDWFEPPEDWRRFLVVDFGYTNPLVGQWWTVDPDECMYLYREFYQTRTLVEDFAAVVKDYPDFGSLEAIVCDHDAEDRATLEKHLGDRQTVVAEKAISSGIQDAQTRIIGTKGKERGQLVLMRDTLINVDGDLVDRGKPKCTSEEIPGYAWAETKKKEEPVKTDDHGCDCIKYACAYLSANGSPEQWVIRPH